MRTDLIDALMMNFAGIRLHARHLETLSLQLHQHRGPQSAPKGSSQGLFFHALSMTHLFAGTFCIFVWHLSQILCVLLFYYLMKSDFKRGIPQDMLEKYSKRTVCARHVLTAVRHSLALCCACNGRVRGLVPKYYENKPSGMSLPCSWQLSLAGFEAACNWEANFVCCFLSQNWFKGNSTGNPFF